MKLVHTITATAIMALGATGALAQSAFDGTVGLTYISAPDDGYDYALQFGGSLMYDISPSFDLQFDLLGATYSNSSNMYLSYGAHVIYALNPNTDLGAYVEADTTGSGTLDWIYIGAEAGYNSGSIEAETFATYAITDSNPVYLVGAQIGYNFDNLGSLPGQMQVYGGYTVEIDGSSQTDNIYAGVKSDITDSLELDLRAASMESGSSRYFSLGLNYNFGKGARFAPRTYYAALPGY